MYSYKGILLNKYDVCYFLGFVAEATTGERSCLYQYLA
jgi:hypothetical protein